MDFEPVLQEGIFLQRYKRFFADVVVQEQTMTVHVPNTGSMEGCKTPRSPCRISAAKNPERKLKFTLEMVKAESSWVGVNTSHPNQLVHEAWRAGLLWPQFDQAQREVKISPESRIDMALWHSRNPAARHFVEIKNVSLVLNGVALFPDAVSTRAQKHLRELMNLVRIGHSAEIVFVVQRTDGHTFAPADHIDAEYGKLLRQSAQAGVAVSAFACALSERAIELIPSPLPLKF